MPKYSQEIIQQVMEANDLVDLVSQYTTLKRSGRSYMGCCPFHSERTPSFSVSREKQLYHCFGCGVGGNVFTFVMEKENMNFPEALSYLAERANITLPQETWRDDAEERKREAIYEMNRLLANHYYTLLKHTPSAQAYADSRGLTPEIIHEFGIGYAADAWQEALNYLSQKKCDVPQMLEAGIEIRSDNGRIYDRFRNRLMIPIQNSRGKIIGFGGRIMQKDAKGPKYLNSPESLVFSKGRELFNLNRAKKHIEDDRLIIVEGYMDVIALYSCGIKNVVAALGTAFTPQHASILNRYVNEVVLCFDGDAAGEKATQRAIGILGNSKLKIFVVRLDEKDDPDSFIRENGADAFREKVKKAKGAIEYQLDFIKKGNPLQTNDERLNYVSQAIPIVAQAKTDIERDVFAKMVAEMTGTSAKMIYDAALKRIKAQDNQDGQDNDMPAFKRYLSGQTQHTSKAVVEAERYVIAALLNGNLPLDDIVETLDSKAFSQGLYRSTYEKMCEMRQDGSAVEPALIIAAFDKPEEQQALSALVMQGEQMAEDENADDKLRESLNVLMRNQNQASVQALHQQIQELPDGSPEAVALLQTIIQLEKNQ